MQRKLLVAALAFVALGMPRSSIGVAWPAAAEEFARPVAELGLLLAIVISVYGTATAVNASLGGRFGAERVLIGGAGLAAVGLIATMLSPGWMLALAGMALTGFGGGLIDASVNTDVALRHGARAMGMLHASYGIGATLGPLAMTLGLRHLGSWRPAFVIFAALQIVVTAGFVVGRRQWAAAPAGPAAPVEVAPVVSRRARNLAVAMFGLLAAVETAGAQWGFSLLTVERGLSDTTAGLAVTGYYAALTGARLLLGVVGGRIDPVSTVRSSSIVALCGALLVWWAPIGWMGAAGFVVLGLGIGPLFPLGMSLTPKRVGAAATPKVVGYQLVAANVGGAGYPAVIGLAVNAFGLAAVGPAVALAAVVLVATSEALRRVPAGPVTIPTEAR